MSTVSVPDARSPQPAGCALTAWAGISCIGPAVFRLDYYRGAGAHRTLNHTISPVCLIHAQYEEQWHRSIGTYLSVVIASGVVEPVKAALTADDCVHADGCPVHPDTHQLHNFDPECGRLDLHDPHYYQLLGTPWPSHVHQSRVPLSEPGRRVCYGGWSYQQRAGLALTWRHPDGSVEGIQSSGGSVPAAGGLAAPGYLMEMVPPPVPEGEMYRKAAALAAMRLLP